MIWVEPALKGGANVLINLSGDNARVLQAFGDRQMVDQVLIRMNKFYPKMRGASPATKFVATAPIRVPVVPTWPTVRQVTRFWRIWEQPLSRVASPASTPMRCTPAPSRARCVAASARPARCATCMPARRR